MEYPSSIKNPFPGSVGASGATSGALFKFLYAEFLPRFNMSRNSLLFDFDKSDGIAKRKSAVNSTLPRELVGANLISVIASLAGWLGSTS